LVRLRKGTKKSGDWGTHEYSRGSSLDCCFETRVPPPQLEGGDEKAVVGIYHKKNFKEKNRKQGCWKKNASNVPRHPLIHAVVWNKKHHRNQAFNVFVDQNKTAKKEKVTQERIEGMYDLSTDRAY